MPLLDLTESKSRWETLQEMNCAEGNYDGDSLGCIFRSESEPGWCLAGS